MPRVGARDFIERWSNFRCREPNCNLTKIGCMQGGGHVTKFQAEAVCAESEGCVNLCKPELNSVA
jgi:hypothetical protein